MPIFTKKYVTLHPILNHKPFFDILAMTSYSSQAYERIAKKIDKNLLL